MKLRGVCVCVDGYSFWPSNNARVKVMGVSGRRKDATAAAFLVSKMGYPVFSISGHNQLYFCIRTQEEHCWGKQGWLGWW
jgi:hypothetical protein